MPYSEKERSIYKLPNTDLSVDPLEVRRCLLIESEGKLQDLIVTFNDSDSELEVAMAEDKLVKIARSAFKIKPVNEGGTTDANVLEYLANFLEWLSTPLVTTIKPSQKSRPCMGCR